MEKQDSAKDIIKQLAMGGVFLYHKGCPSSWFSGSFETEEAAWRWAEEHLVDWNSCPGCGGSTPPPVGRHYGTLTK